VNPAIQAVALAAFVAAGTQYTMLGSQGHAVGTLTSDAQNVSAATPVTATVATPRRRRHADHTALATPAGATYDDAAIEEQMRLRVISPPLSGDGGG
jgi:hypothetical protein